MADKFIGTERLAWKNTYNARGRYAIANGQDITFGIYNLIVDDPNRYVGVRIILFCGVCAGLNFRRTIFPGNFDKHNIIRSLYIIFVLLQ